MNLKILYISSLIIITGFNQKPVSTIFLIGDSTVRNGQGDGSNGEWGWGDFLYQSFDTTKIKIFNRAMGGRSSRTYIEEGRWNTVHDQVKAGDYVIIQFGHNDDGPINDDYRARGTIKGNGEETEVIDNMITKRREIVKSYGWYIRKYIADTKAKGAIPIVCSLVARNRWEDGKIIRNTDDYTQWAKEAAEMEGAYFIDLNDLVATEYEKLGKDYVSNGLFPNDNTHTNMEGAKLNATLVADEIKKLNGCGLSAFVK